MATVPSYRRILREDVPGAPAYIDIFISVMNQTFQDIINALNRKLTFAQNINCQIKQFSITAGAAPTDNTFKFSLTLTKGVEGLIPMQFTQEEATYTPLTSAPYINWHAEQGSVVIDSIIGLTNGKNYTITVLVV